MSEYDLTRFLEAQEHGAASWTANYAVALAEMRAGRKHAHWIWYVFPQLKGLGSSPYAVQYGIDGLSEARAYLQEPTLRARLIEIAETLLQCKDDISLIAGWPDDMKIHASMTLFHLADPTVPVFRQVLEQFYAGDPHPGTLRLLKVKWQ